MATIQTIMVRDGEAEAKDIKRLSGMFRPFPGMAVAWEANQAQDFFINDVTVGFDVNIEVVTYNQMDTDLNRTVIDTTVHFPSNTQKSNVYGRIMLVTKNLMADAIMDSMNKHEYLNFEFDK